MDEKKLMEEELLAASMTECTGLMPPLPQEQRTGGQSGGAVRRAAAKRPRAQEGKEGLKKRSRAGSSTRSFSSNIWAKANCI